MPATHRRSRTTSLSALLLAILLGVSAAPAAAEEIPGDAPVTEQEGPSEAPVPAPVPEAEPEPEVPPVSGDPANPALPPVGDPLYEGLPPTLGAASATAADPDFLFPGAALLTDGITAAHIDVDAQRVYSVTRSAIPAELLISGFSEGPVAREQLPVGAGAWDIAQSGSTLAIGTAGAMGASTTHVIGFSTETDEFTNTAVLPSSSYVMTVAEDRFLEEEGNGRYFWAGTYHASGAKLFRVDLETGTAVDYTPAGGAWAGFRYVRSLAVDAQGVTIGLGSPASVWRLSADQTRPVPWDAATEAVTDQSFAYATASAELGEEVSYSVVGTEVGAEGSARIAVLDNRSGERVAQHDVAADTVDRISVDVASGTAWFTVRPSGAVYSMDLHDPAVAPVSAAEPVGGSETRGLLAQGGDVWGITGTSDLWRWDRASGSLGGVTQLVPHDQQMVDAVPQGLAQFGDRVLVAGHWRYQVHGDETTSAIRVPGEPKAQAVVGDRLFSAVYPSAQVYEVSADLTVSKVAEIGHHQMRPSAIVYSERLNSLAVATGPAYGLYGGGLSLVDPDRVAQPRFFRPVGDHLVRSLVPMRDGFVLGSSILGESAPAPSNARALIRYWEPDGSETGRAVWTQDLVSVPGAGTVTGVTIVNDEAGSFVLASLAAVNPANGRPEGWLVALDPRQDGALLWQQRVGSTAFDLNQVDSRVTALVDGRVRRLAPTRSALVGTPVAQLEGFQSSFASFSARSDRSTSLAFASSGAEGRAGRVTLDPERDAFRIAGDNRYGTAAAVSRDTYARARTVVLARGDSFADALSAGPLAAALDAPILLVAPGGVLTPETRAEIARLGATRAIPIGGTGAIPDSVREWLPEDVTLTGRLGGSNRYETSIAVAERLQSVLGRSNIGVIATSGLVFADAIAAGPAAIAADRAIVLVDDIAGMQQTGEFLSARRVRPVGGPAATAVRELGLSTESAIVGENRYDTASRLAASYFPATDHAYIASGLDYPDGLSAGVLAGRRESPLLLSSPTSLPAPTIEVLRRGQGSRSAVLVGGTGVLHPVLEPAVRSGS